MSQLTQVVPQRVGSAPCSCDTLLSDQIPLAVTETGADAALAMAGLDPDAALEFLQLLWPSGLPPDAFITLWEPHKGALQLGIISEAASAIVTRQYISCAAMKEVSSGRGGKRDAAALPGFYFDFDLIDGVHKTDERLMNHEQALQFLATLPLPPTLIIDSGGGFHVWWLLREPWVFEKAEERERAARLLSNMQNYVIQRARALGFHLDYTGDLARVLRSPGTLNCKYQPPRQVKLLSKTGFRYNPSDFEEWLPTTEPRAPPVKSMEAIAAPQCRTIVEFNRTAPWETILAGWTRLTAQMRDDQQWTHWRRPGKSESEGGSASTGTAANGDRVLHVFSSNARPFAADQNYSPFAAYAMLHCDGNRDAAMTKLGLVADQQSSTLPYVPFPIDQLPHPVLRAAVEELCERTDGDAGAIVPMLLATLSGEIGGSYWISPQEGYIQPPTLWTANLARSGSTKTARIRECTAALDRWDKDLRERAAFGARQAKEREEQRNAEGKIRTDEIRDQRKSLERARKAASKKAHEHKIAVSRLTHADKDSARSRFQIAANVAEQELEEARKEVDSLQKALEAHQVVEPRESESKQDSSASCAVVTDTTMPALLWSLKSNLRGLTWVTDEAAGLLGSLNEYTKGGADQERLLKLRDGTPLAENRKGLAPDGSPGSFRLDTPLLAIVAAGTPGRFFELMKRNGGFSSGLAARFWLNSPPCEPVECRAPGTRDWPAIARLREVERRLTELPFSGDPHVIGLTADADKYWRAFATETRFRASDLAEGPMQSFVSKAEGEALRVALNFHLFRREAGEVMEDSERVDAKSMESAIEIVRWACHEFERVLAMYTDVTDTTATTVRQKVLAAFDRRGAMTLRDARNSSREFQRMPHQDFEGMLCDLVSGGELQSETVRTAGRSKEVFGRCPRQAPPDCTEFEVREVADEQLVNTSNPIVAIGRGNCVGNRGAAPNSTPTVAENTPGDSRLNGGDACA